MALHQISVLSFSYVSVDSHLLYLKKYFFEGPQWKKNHSAFLCYFCHRTSYIYFFIILHYSSVFNCKFIWKSYVNFSFIEFIFVMVKDTYFLPSFLPSLLTYLLTYLLNFIKKRLQHRCFPVNIARPLKTPFL